MKKLKLKPAYRDKSRYFLVGITGKDIDKIILKYLGIFGAAKVGYIEIKTAVENTKFSTEPKIIGSCLREYIDDVRAALSMEKINVEKVSGTIKGLE